MFSYIPPSTSNWFQSSRSLTFESLQEECANFDFMGRVLLCGDFNARTSDAIDYIDNDEIDDFLPMENNYEPDIPLNARINDDKDFINTSGQLLIDFCKSMGYKIMKTLVLLLV